MIPTLLSKYLDFQGGFFVIKNKNVQKNKSL